MAELRLNRRGWFRIVLFAIGAITLGFGMSVAIVGHSVGFVATSAVLRTMWEDLKNQAGPALSSFDNIAGKVPSQDDDAIFHKVAEYILKDSSVQRCAFARETRWPHPEQVTVASLNLELIAKGTRGRPFDQGAISDLLTKNRRSLRLHKVPLPERGILVSAGVLDDLVKNHDKTWQQDLSARYAGASGYLVFSRPGFTFDGKGAIIYVELICGATCGGGYFLQFERQSGSWQLTFLQESWVS